MGREEINSKIWEYFREQSKKSHDFFNLPKISMNNVSSLICADLLRERNMPQNKITETASITYEIIQEFFNNGFIYFGEPDYSGNSHYPWITITEYGKKVFESEDWLPYDPDGYLRALKVKVPDIDDITFSYIGESVSNFNKRQLLSATITLGVASENLMLTLIESYLNGLKDLKRKKRLEVKIKDRFIYTQYKEFKQEFIKDIKNLPKDLQSDWETYLEGIFNFIRLNRNSVGHPTGKKLDAKTVYANLQIFADYADYIFKLIKYFS